MSPVTLSVAIQDWFNGSLVGEVFDTVRQTGLHVRIHNVVDHTRRTGGHPIVSRMSWPLCPGSVFFRDRSRVKGNYYSPVH